MAHRSPLLLALIAIVAAAYAIAPAAAAVNVYGDTLQRCSGNGQALTGFTRNGHCVDQNDDAGSHHICIDMASTTGGNFCTVTQQPNWCSSSMPCDGDTSRQCPVKHWCVCQWAFAAYIEKAGGCDKIQNIVCPAINKVALTAYEEAASGSDRIANALACLKSKCNVGVASEIAEAQLLKELLLQQQQHQKN